MIGVKHAEVKRLVFLITMFVAAYLASYLLAEQTSAWVSPAFYLMPAAGFVFLYLGCDWAKKAFKSSLPENPLFLLIFLLSFFFAFYIALYFFYQNIIAAYEAAGIKTMICTFDCAFMRDAMNKGLIEPMLLLDYFKTLKSTPMPLFLISGVFGWLAFFLDAKFGKKLWR